MRNIQNFLLGALALLVSCSTPNVTEKTPVDYVNPYMGNINGRRQQCRFFTEFLYWLADRC